MQRLGGVDYAWELKILHQNNIYLTRLSNCPEARPFWHEAVSAYGK